MKVNRRTFINIAMTVTIGLFVAIWNKISLTQMNQSKKRKRTLPFDKSKQIAFIDEFIIINQAGETMVFLSHCTHLGCKINQTNNSKLVCPCHGSEYDLDGQVIKGPAYKNLRAVNFEISENSSQIEIEN